MHGAGQPAGARTLLFLPAWPARRIRHPDISGGL